MRGLSLVAAGRNHSVVVCGLLIVVASLDSFQSTGSKACGLSGCGAWA